jgi:hypothetical protein
MAERSHRYVWWAENQGGWVTGMQWGVKMSKDYGGRPGMEGVSKLKRNIWTTVISVMTSELKLVSDN